MRDRTGGSRSAMHGGPAVSQLALPLRLNDAQTFASFHAGPNAAALAQVRRLAAAPVPPLWLWGAPGSGKSHLLNAACTASAADGARVACLPLGELRAAGAGVLDGLGDAALLCLDDLHAVAGDPDWELALFGLWNALHDTGGRLLLSSREPPAALGLALPDLVSRLAAATVYRLAPLDEADLLQALALRAGRRGLELPEETGRWLLRRLPRDTATLFDLLDRLDTASLAAQRRLTVPFVRQALLGASGSD